VCLETSTARDPNASLERFKMGVIFHPESARSINQDTGTHFNTLYELSQLFLDQIGLSNNHGGIKQVGTVIKFNSGISLAHKPLSSVSVLSDDLRKVITSIFERQKRIFMNQMEKLRLSLQPSQPVPPHDPAPMVNYSTLDETSRVREP
jgi:hypothetical protein